MLLLDDDPGRANQAWKWQCCESDVPLPARAWVQQHRRGLPHTMRNLRLWSWGHGIWTAMLLVGLLNFTESSVLTDRNSLRWCSEHHWFRSDIVARQHLRYDLFGKWFVSLRWSRCYPILSMDWYSPQHLGLSDWRRCRRIPVSHWRRECPTHLDWLLADNFRCHNSTHFYSRCQWQSKLSRKGASDWDSTSLYQTY